MIKKLGVVGILFTAVMLLLPSAPAKADVGAGAVNGGGGITPGLTLVPTSQSGSFAGRVVGVHGAAVLDVNCNFTFQSTILETELEGEGTAQGTCSGGGTSVVCASASLRYERVVAEVEINGRCNVNNVSHKVEAHLAFAPTSSPGTPVTSYALAGEVDLDTP